MKNHKGRKRGFSQLSRAWHAHGNLSPRLIDEITVGFYHPGGGTTGEFSIQWVPLASQVVARLVVFNDAWHALFEFKDVLEFMAGVDSEDISADAFRNALVSLGIEDMTKVTQGG